VPLLLDESGGGVVDGLDWSAGGGVLCMEFDELESGEAGAVVEESEGALGAADCCFEHATIASALRHNKRRLRFIDTSLCSCLSGGSGRPGRTQRLAASSVPPPHFLRAGKLEATATPWAP
jgi:hypothetical protein